MGEELLGRVLDGLGNPIDGKGPILCKTEYSLNADPPHPLSRPRIHDSLYVGVRAIDGLITMGEGQRIGIMAGSGVGKSTLLSMIARNTEADISVIALVGERGREVLDVIAGACFICARGEESFASLTEAQARHLAEKFRYPERFVRTEAGIEAVPYKPKEQSKER